MPTSSAADLARRLGENAEAVCRHYLPNGRREGRYWIVGDVANARGRSLYVRLFGPSAGKGAAGKWTDAATGDHGDLLDMIRLNRGCSSLCETLDEARAFLRLPPEVATAGQRIRAQEPAPCNSPEAARRLFGAGKPVRGTIAAIYLKTRGLAHAVDFAALRFHPCCYTRVAEHGTALKLPALLAAVTDLDGTVTGVSRTWLAKDGTGKADLKDPRRALGSLLGSAVRFPGSEPHVLVAGEGIETVLSLRRVLPRIPMAAALSANHLAATALPPGLRCLYVARDRDGAGEKAFQTLRDRARASGIPDVRGLEPIANDFNADLLSIGPEALARHIAPQLDPKDAARLLHVSEPQASCAA